MSQMKGESDMRVKLAQLLAVDARVDPPGIRPGMTMFQKAAAVKTLLWALGENDDDRWHITAIPGPPVDRRARARN